MSKELDIIALSTDVGVLPEKLEEANNAKNLVEGKLSEKVMLTILLLRYRVRFIIFFPHCKFTERVVARDV